MANRRFNTQVAQPRKALAKGGKALKAVDKEKIQVSLNYQLKSETKWAL